MIMNYISSYVEHLRLIICRKWDIITKVKARLERKINVTLPALLPNKMTGDLRGPATSSDETGHGKLCSRNKRAIPLLAIAQRNG